MAKYLVIVRRESIEEAEVVVEASGRIKATEIALSKANYDTNVVYRDTGTKNSSYCVSIEKLDPKNIEITS